MRLSVSSMLTPLVILTSIVLNPSIATADSLPIPITPSQLTCRSMVGSEPGQAATLKQTFRDDFNQHPLANGRWTPHFLGSPQWPESLYWGGENSDIKRKNRQAGEQQIYVDPSYAGLAGRPLNLDPFIVAKGLLTIRAKRTPPELKKVLFDNEYISGVLTTASSFRQKYGYFEIRARIPFGTAVWPAFWLLPDDTSWPPEIDVFEGRGGLPGTLAMTAHWKDPTTGKLTHCSRDVVIPDAQSTFHTYGVLWQEDMLTFYVDRLPVEQIPTPPNYVRPMYMLINTAVGSKGMRGVGRVDTTTPDPIDFVIDYVAAYIVEDK